MTSSRVRIMMWALGTIAALAALAGVALQLAISRNGPAVLSAVDRMAGGNDNATRRAVVPIGDHPAQKLHVWGVDESEDGRASRPVLLFVHGGSWSSGDPVDYGFIGRSFVPKGFVVVLAGYRLHPDAVYPAMLEDTARAIAWAKRDIARYGGDPARIVVAGHSAGAYNVVQVALEEQWLGREGLKTGDIAGVVGLAGPYDFYPFDSDSTINSFGEAANPQATQPISHARGDAPPMLLIHGQKDTLVKPRNTHELARRLTAEGSAVTTRFYPEMNHNDPLISLAAPWRNSRDVDELIAEFAMNSGRSGETSVPVHGETR